MNPQLTLALAKANQDEFLRRAAGAASGPRQPRTNPINLVRPALSAVMRHTISGRGPVRAAGARA
jgi:hypothetical protein